MCLARRWRFLQQKQENEFLGRVFPNFDEFLEDFDLKIGIN